MKLTSEITIGLETFPVIAGPCVIESADLTLDIATTMAAICTELQVPLIFKASFDKANRSSIESFRGPGQRAGLGILSEVKNATGLPILTDIHQPEQCKAAAEICSVLQIPAFLCRQTDLILAAGHTGRAVNIKKGQFMSPEDMLRAVDKVRSTGNENVSVTERGASFGYRNLVVDMRSFPLMQRDGIPVIYDVTHSLQLPGAAGDHTGGQREFAEPLARAAVAAGADGIYLEVHPAPDKALSDSATQLDPERARQLLGSLVDIRNVLNRGETSE